MAPDLIAQGAPMRNDAASETLEDDLLDLVAEEGMIERAALDREAKLADLNIASADFIMILMAIEEKYGKGCPGCGQLACRCDDTVKK